MKNIITTDKSFLNTHSYEKKEELIKNCIEEIKDKLLENPQIEIYGKTATQHRSIGFFSDTSIGYYYSGQLAKSQKLTPNLKILLEKINKKFNTEFNGILINKYKDGIDYIGPHSDDEAFLDKGGVIALSHGASRTFRIRNKITKKIIEDIPTESNHIIHMGGNFQKEFTHEIPIEKKVLDTRYSLTFRRHMK